MRIKELSVSVRHSRIRIAWSVSDGEQSAYDLFLIEKGAVTERSQQTGDAASCTLLTPAAPMKEYHLLLTVRCGEQLSTARAAFCTGRDSRLRQNSIL